MSEDLYIKTIQNNYEQELNCIETIYEEEYKKYYT